VAYLSAFLALRQAGFRAGQSVLAPGAGGSVGNATPKVARALGASQLLSTAGRPAKEAADAADGGLRDVAIVNLQRESLPDGLARLAPGGVDIVMDVRLIRPLIPASLTEAAGLRVEATVRSEPRSFE
jgi:NADPH:quinone reductase